MNFITYLHFRIMLELTKVQIYALEVLLPKQVKWQAARLVLHNCPSQYIYNGLVFKPASYQQWCGDRLFIKEAKRVAKAALAEVRRQKTSKFQHARFTALPAKNYELQEKN